MEALAREYGFDLNTPYKDLPEKAKHIFIHGTDGKPVKVHYQSQRGHGVYDVAFEGLIKNIERRYRETTSEAVKQEYETFMRSTPCRLCQGKRLRKEALAVTVGGKNIAELTEMSVSELAKFMENIKLTDMQMKIGEMILKEIKARLSFLINVGLDYLTLARATGTCRRGGPKNPPGHADRIGTGRSGVYTDEPTSAFTSGITGS